MRASSGSLRQSSIFRAAEWLGRGASVWSLPGERGDAAARPAAPAVGRPDHRGPGPGHRRLRGRRALIFSSVEQGIEFEAMRGLQVARGLFLQQVQQLAAGAAALGRRHGAAARAGRSAGLGAPAPRRAVAVDPERAVRDDGRHRPRGRALHARQLRGRAQRGRRGALEPADRSPVILRALGYERTVSVERARDRLVVRAALPLVDPAMRMLGHGGRHGGHRRDGRRQPEGGARRGARGGRLRGQRSERVDVHGRDGRAARGPAAARRLQRRRAGHRARRSFRWRSRAIPTRSRSASCRT